MFTTAAKTDAEMYAANMTILPLEWQWPNFINAWNEYTIALTLIQDDLLKPITVGINIFYGYNFIQWQYLFATSLFATSLFATIPVIVLFLCIEKHLVAGLKIGRASCRERVWTWV